MRVRLPFGRTLFFLGAFFLAMIALLPMRLALDWFGIGQRGVAAREVQGSVWFGALKEAQVGNVGLGDMHARLRASRSTATRAFRRTISAGRRRSPATASASTTSLAGCS